MLLKAEKLEEENRVKREESRAKKNAENHVNVGVEVAEEEQKILALIRIWDFIVSQMFCLYMKLILK